MSWVMAMASSPVRTASGSMSGTVAPIYLPRAMRPPKRAWPSLFRGAVRGMSGSAIFSTGRALMSGQSACSRGSSRVKIELKLGAVASRSVKGFPRSHRSRMVASKEVARCSSVTTVRSGIQAEIANVGIRTPERSKVKPN